MMIRREGDSASAGASILPSPDAPVLNYSRGSLLCASLFFKQWEVVWIKCSISSRSIIVMITIRIERREGMGERILNKSCIMYPDSRRIKKRERCVSFRPIALSPFSSSHRIRGEREILILTFRVSNYSPIPFFFSVPLPLLFSTVPAVKTSIYISSHLGIERIEVIQWKSDHQMEDDEQNDEMWK